jgi:hypothetical protein
MANLTLVSLGAEVMNIGDVKGMGATHGLAGALAAELVVIAGAGIILIT